ncbi:MAG TPA: hypothetical protein VFZ63_03135 [Jiangellaceae bacterium]
MILIVVAVVLLIVAAGLTVAALVAGRESVTFDVFDQTVSTTVGIVFLAGVIAGLVLLGAIAAAMVGSRRARARRREMRELRHKVAALESDERTHTDESEPAEHADEPSRRREADRVAGQP